MRLVIKTVLPERLSPVTASQTVAPPANSPRLPARRSEACTTIGGSQLKLIIGLFHVRRHRHGCKLVPAQVVDGRDQVLGWAKARVLSALPTRRRHSE